MIIAQYVAWCIKEASGKVKKCSLIPSDGGYGFVIFNFVVVFDYIIIILGGIDRFVGIAVSSVGGILFTARVAAIAQMGLYLPLE